MCSVHLRESILTRLSKQEDAQHALAEAVNHWIWIMHHLGRRNGHPVVAPAWKLYLKDHYHRLRTGPSRGCAASRADGRVCPIHCPAESKPDLAQCFFCFKELEGWEPDDDPIEEHKKHSSGCAFLSVKKQFEELSLSEFVKLDKENQEQNRKENQQ